MGNRKQPNPPPGAPGYRGSPQVKPAPPPAPPRHDPFIVTLEIRSDVNGYFQLVADGNLIATAASRDDRGMDRFQATCDRYCQYVRERTPYRIIVALEAGGIVTPRKAHP